MMALKRLFGLVALLTVLVSSIGFASPTVAQDAPANEAAEVCREDDAAGLLDELGITRGECVNLVQGPSSKNANNFIAAFCGSDGGLAVTETTNKGQCIKVLRAELL